MEISELDLENPKVYLHTVIFQNCGSVGFVLAKNKERKYILAETRENPQETGGYIIGLSFEDVWFSIRKFSLANEAMEAWKELLNGNLDPKSLSLKKFT